jgi:TPR repeat protein
MVQEGEVWLMRVFASSIRRLSVALPLLFLLYGCKSIKDGNSAKPSEKILSEANAGNPKEQAHLGWMYANGHDLPHDDSKAAEWWRKAAENGNAYAQLALGMSYATGKGVPKDDQQAALWWRKSAEQGNNYAQYNLGFAYHDGRGVPQDYAQSAVWYRKAAENGNAGAQDNLGFAYAIGQGIQQDDTQAIVWYQKAAEQGDANAQLDLGAIYDEGPDVPKDYASEYLGKTLAWTTVKRNHKTQRNYKDAYFWVDLAVAGDLDVSDKKCATSLRDSIAKHLTSKELLNAQARASQWFEQHKRVRAPQ